MSEAKKARQEFLAGMFEGYYKSKFFEGYAPTDIEHREFGLVYWWSSQFKRHLGFSSFQDLSDHVRSKVPRHLHSSAARYGLPDAPNMKLKKYLNCDLVFDLDVDKIPSPCKKAHDRWRCRKCGRSGRGMTPKLCPGCESKSFDVARWECETCMEVVKSEVFLLVEEFLAEDFGLDSNRDLFIAFSGQRGYHVHVGSEVYLDLDTNARREIVDYIIGKELMPKSHGLTLWRKRMARLVLKLLEEDSLGNLQKILPEAVDVGNLQGEVVALLNSKSPTWTFTSITVGTWDRLVQRAIEKYGMKVDEPVTIDVHRLIRLPGSLHGSTGFLVKKLTLNELERFDPFSHAQVFAGEKRIYVERSPAFRMGGESFGPLKDERVELPMNAAIFLLCKELAFLGT